jgi:hypothetical protein
LHELLTEPISSLALSPQIRALGWLSISPTSERDGAAVGTGESLELAVRDRRDPETFGDLRHSSRLRPRFAQNC